MTLSGGWAAEKASQPVQERGASPRKVIDTHTHFYDPSRPQGVPWPPKDDKLLYRTVLPEHYRALPAPQPVAGTVVVEASSWVDDNQWILDLAAREPFIVGLVGNLPVGRAEFREHLDRLSRDSLFRGLRVNGGSLKDGLRQSRFVADLQLLADRDLALDLLIGPEMLPSVPELAKECPHLRVVIDHVANLRVDGQAPDGQWVRGMRAAAEHKKVYCKVSGLVEGTGRADSSAPREVRFYTPVLDVVWDAFGPDRLVYGSNWPVSERFAPLAAVQQLVNDYFASKGQAALDKVFCENSLAAYKWVKREPK